ncbi:UNKNOWN [Stylonychia lemnae]|uniref:RING-type domain-containing protein n=1 Tax=Stylonychia lemnae TaxID=5949 RepID=A0A078AV36_STYLE|nr:UNKNOWN [Stylonychia lemnae]|eukprot:CDW86260.1 UNKNOWN [Stylonychia lemnae]
MPCPASIYEDNQGDNMNDFYLNSSRRSFENQDLNLSRSSMRDSNKKLHEYVEQMITIDKNEANMLGLVPANDLQKSTYSENKDLALINEQPSEQEHSTLNQMNLINQFGSKQIENNCESSELNSAMNDAEIKSNFPINNIEENQNQSQINNVSQISIVPSPQIGPQKQISKNLTSRKSNVQQMKTISEKPEIGRKIFHNQKFPKQEKSEISGRKSDYQQRRFNTQILAEKQQSKNETNPQFKPKRNACEICKVEFKIYDPQMQMMCGHRCHPKCVKDLIGQKNQTKIGEVIRKQNPILSNQSEKENQGNYQNNNHFIKPKLIKGEKFDAKSLFQSVKCDDCSKQQ